MNFDDLKSVNTVINELPYEFSVSELWQPPTDHAACSNDAVAKFRMLLTRGWPKESMRLACCYVPDYPEGKNYHAVLCVDYEGQTWVLDNRNYFPIEYQDLPYKFDKIWSWTLNDWEKV